MTRQLGCPPIHAAISAFHKTWDDANDEMKLFMMKLKDDGKLSGEMPKKVKVLYSAMYVYIELAENLLKVINLHSNGKVIRQVATFYNEVYSKWFNLNEENVFKKCVRAHILLVVALYFIPKAERELDIAAALFIIEIIPAFVRVMRHQASIGPKAEREVMIAIINGLYSPNRSFGSITNTTYTPVVSETIVSEPIVSEPIVDPYMQSESGNVFHEHVDNALSKDFFIRRC